jgi:methylenetetrahydrofolate dehydrogenase (NADP+)/methenyltetrahydrofolate cyclohydrolase
MTARLLEGKPVADRILAEVSARVTALAAEGVRTRLGVVLVGEDPASLSYVAGKERACARLGIASETMRLPESSDISDVLACVAALNSRDEVHGILVQSPLAAGIDEGRVIEYIDPRKDVDGFHPSNIGKLIAGRKARQPCTPAGIVELLAANGISTSGEHVVIVGRSNIVGRPLANMLSRKGAGGDATVTLCHSRTPDLGRFTRQAGILVAAVGRPGTITPEMVREGSVVIDVGVNRVPDASAKKGYRLVGDVNFEGTSEKASAITPVPGGVGPLTVAMLMRNTVEAAEELSGVP